MFNRERTGLDLIGLLRQTDWIWDGECLNCDSWDYEDGL